MAIFLFILAITATLRDMSSSFHPMPDATMGIRSTDCGLFCRNFLQQLGIGVASNANSSIAPPLVIPEIVEQRVVRELPPIRDRLGREPAPPRNEPNRRRVPSSYIALSKIGRFWMLSDSQARVFSAHPPVFTLNKFSGLRISQIFEALQRSDGDIPSQVEQLAIFAGTNDVLHGRAPDLIKSDMKSLIDLVRVKKFHGLIIVIGIPIAGRLTDDTNIFLRSGIDNDRYGDNVSFLDIKMVVSENGNVPTSQTLCTDRVHITVRAGHLLASSLRDVHSFEIPQN